MTRRPSAGRARAAAAVLAIGALAVPAAIPAQEALERPPNVSGGWVGVPWTAYFVLPHRFRDVDPGPGIDYGRTTTFTGALGLPYRSAAVFSWVSSSVTVPGEPDELEARVRHRPLATPSAPVDLSITAGWNFAAESLDAEAALSRWLGPVRLIGAARWFSDALGSGDDRFAFAAGAVWHPLPGRVPVALTGDVAAPLDLADDEEPAWSAGIQVGIPHTPLMLSLQASNTAATTLQGATLATGGRRLGFELTGSIPAGYFFGLYPPRDEAAESVAAEPGGAADAVVEIRRYAYGPMRVVVRAGAVVEWVNRDAVVHTATAEDGAWDSGGIPPGERWSARFDRPGTYAYLCGPHPFMKGVVIVR